MSEIMFESKVTGLGSNAFDFIKENMVVFFNHKAQAELARYSVLIDDAKSDCNAVVGDFLVLGDTEFKITAIGEVAIKNLNNLGHVVIKFDGKTTPDLPGNIHVEKKEIVSFVPQMPIYFKK